MLNPDLNEASIYIFRQTGMIGSAAGAKLFIDFKAKCKLQNNIYIVWQIPSGRHVLVSQFYGKKPKTNSFFIDKDFQPLKTYYFKLSLEQSISNLEELKGNSLRIHTDEISGKEGEKL